MPICSKIWLNSNYNAEVYIERKQIVPSYLNEFPHSFKLGRLWNPVSIKDIRDNTTLISQSNLWHHSLDGRPALSYFSSDSF